MFETWCDSMIIIKSMYYIYSVISFSMDFLWFQFCLFVMFWISKVFINVKIHWLMYYVLYALIEIFLFTEAIFWSDTRERALMISLIQKIITVFYNSWHFAMFVTCNELMKIMKYAVINTDFYFRNKQKAIRPQKN